jgi:anti-sigma factor RsiW
MDEIACKQLVELVTDYLEGALPEDERRRFEDHLESCPFCVEYVEQMREVGGGLRGIATEGFSAQRRQALIEAFRDL